MGRSPYLLLLALILRGENVSNFSDEFHAIDSPHSLPKNLDVAAKNGSDVLPPELPNDAVPPAYHE